MMKTGLVLGGGGSRGAYEVGVWQALREMGINIDVVTGTSVGAINGALVIQGAFDLAVSTWKELETHMVFDLKEGHRISDKFDFNIDIGGMPLGQLNSYALEIVKKGGADVSGLKALLKTHLDESAIRNSPIDFGLVAVEYPGLKPYYLQKNDIPEGQLVDYILASAACFPALKIYDIGDKKFIDGAYSDNLPINLALDMGAETIIAVDLETLGVLQKTRSKDTDNLITISSPWDLGNFLVFDKINSARIMRLGYLDALKRFDFYEGHYFTFAKGEFGKKEVLGADAAARIFLLNPEFIYKKSLFNGHLKSAMDAHRQMTTDEIGPGLDRFLGLFSRLKKEIIKARLDLNGKSLTLELAEDIRQNRSSKSLFLARNTKKLLNDEIAAAEYIIKAGLI